MTRSRPGGRRDTGKADAHAAMERATGGALPSVNDIAMFEAAVLVAATLLQASAACEEAREMAAAFRKVGWVVLAWMRGLRALRGSDGEPVPTKIIDQAGLERHRRL